MATSPVTKLTNIFCLRTSKPMATTLISYKPKLLTSTTVRSIYCIGFWTQQDPCSRLQIHFWVQIGRPPSLLEQNQFYIRCGFFAPCSSFPYPSGRYHLLASHLGSNSKFFISRTKFQEFFLTSFVSLLLIPCLLQLEI
jgi:hypothetical protein